MALAQERWQTEREEAEVAQIEADHQAVLTGGKWDETIISLFGKLREQTRAARKQAEAEDRAEAEARAASGVGGEEPHPRAAGAAGGVPEAKTASGKKAGRSGSAGAETVLGSN